VEQVGRLDALDGPEMAKSDLLDEGAGFLNGVHAPLGDAAVDKRSPAPDLVRVHKTSLAPNRSRWPANGIIIPQGGH
jgi:hypothetical protein